MALVDADGAELCPLDSVGAPRTSLEPASLSIGNSKSSMDELMIEGTAVAAGGRGWQLSALLDDMLRETGSNCLL